MKEGDFKQDFFITEDGYINVKLKVKTEDKKERERIIASLMGNLAKGIEFDINSNIQVEQIYFKNHNPLTSLVNIKEQIMSDINGYFDDKINNLK